MNKISQSGLAGVSIPLSCMHKCAAAPASRCFIPALLLAVYFSLASGTVLAQQLPPGDISAPARPAAAPSEVQQPDEKPPWVYAPLKPSGEQSKVIREIAARLRRYHFIDITLDDQLSSRLFDKYLERLDPRRHIFLQADIEEFSGYRHQLDDALRSRNLEPAYRIFNRYRKRAIERLEKEITQLAAHIEAFDFTRDESILLERDEEPYAATAAAADDLWRKQIKSQVLDMFLTAEPPEKIRETIGKRLRERLRQLQQSKSQDVFSLYMNSYTELYDSHTNYMSPSSAENFNINMSLSLEGIGAMLRSRDEYTEVVSLVPGGPADKQGDLAPGDRIIAISQGEEQPVEEIIGWRLDDIISRIRGPRGSRVLLSVLPAGEQSLEAVKVVPIVRNRVQLSEQGASKRIVELERNGRIFTLGIIDLPSFYLDFQAMQRREPDYRSTSRDVARILEELQEADVDGVIVDLRDNGGGSLLEANSLVGLFIDKGPTVQVRHSVRRLSRQGKFRPSPHYAGSLAVLINRLSASASEIFSGAIQDYGRGVVIGAPSFGKGTVQSLHRLSSGQMKITDAKFYRISGDSTQRRGIVPDVLYPSLYDAQDYGESVHENTLPWDRITPLRHRRYYRIFAVRPELQARHARRTAQHPEFVYLTRRAAYQQKKREQSKSLSLNKELRQRKHLLEKNEQEALKQLRRTQERSAGAQAAIGPETAAEDGHQPDTGASTVRDTVSDDSAQQVSAAAAADDAPHSSKQADADQEQKEVSDPLLLEAGEILIDSMELLADDDAVPRSPFAAFFRTRQEQVYPVAGQ